MTEEAPQTRTVTVERTLPHPPAKVWRALTQPALIADWLMPNDFALTPGHRFTLTGEWGAVDCEVRTIEEARCLSYTWVAMGVDTAVTFTLTPTDAGTHLRMEQTGFRPDQAQAYGGARAAWGQLLAALEEVASGLD